MIFCIDFDGTIVTHEYPKIGRDIGAFPVLKKMQNNGHQIILFTMRSGSTLDHAVRYLKVYGGIELFGINENPNQKEWTNSPKAYGHIYIDDAALGCPLVHPIEGRPYVDWKAIEKILMDRRIEGFWEWSMGVVVPKGS